MCIRPINVRQADGRYIKCKCGKCLECLSELRNSWVIRMEQELDAAHGKGVFFTLTYGDNAIPKNFLVYEQNITDTPKLYESYSDYDYTTPVGFRGKKSVCEPADKVLRQFYRDYEIQDMNITNNYKEALKPYEEIFNDIEQVGFSESTSAAFDWFSDYDAEHCFAAFDIPQSSGNSVPYHFNSKVVSQAVKDYYNDMDFSEFVEVITREKENDEVITDCGYKVIKTDKGYEYIDILSASQRREFEEEVRSSSLRQICGHCDYNRERQEEVDRCALSAEVSSAAPEDLIKPFLVLSFNSCRQKDLQDWLKRGRAKLSKQGKHFTYFITSEYGPRTLRPHYHGCFFGVSAEEVRFMFQDWESHFGRHDCRKSSYTFDDIKGTQGCSYCAKYCAKGFYEHPLCSKDFFYLRKKPVQTGDNVLDTLLNKLEFSEYHSKKYERCIEYFGIDAPIVEPTFKLVSKGLGVSYVSKMKGYFGTEDFEEKITLAKLGSDYEKEFTNYMEELQRYFHYTNKAGFTFNMPNYYREKMFSDTLRHAYTLFIRSQYDRLYLQKFRELQASGAFRKDTEIISHMEEEERREKLHRLEKKLENTEKFFNKSKI